MTLLKLNGKKVDVEKSLLALDRADCEDSLYVFLRNAWKYIDSSPFTDGWPIEAVAEHLQAVCDGDIRRLIINIPPRMGKSSITSVAFPAWVWAQSHTSHTSGPGTQFLHASYAQQLSLRDSVKCRRLIESPWYQSLWGDRYNLVGDQNTKTRFDNNKNGSRLSTSVGSALTGEGGSIIVVDDPNAAQEAFSEATIAATIDWWDNALSTRLNDPKRGAYVIIQQRLSEEDLTGHILSKDVGEWTHLMLPMRYDPLRAYPTSIGWTDPRKEAGELLWPERYGEQEVEILEKQLGPWAAAGQLQQSPEPKGGGIIKRDWWQLWDEDAYPPMDTIIASLDTAYTTKSENDFSAMTVWGIFSGDITAQNAGGERIYKQNHPRVMLMNAWQEKLELHDLVKKVAETMKAMKADKLLIENKAAGHSVAQEIRRLYGYETFSVQMYDPKSTDKYSRLYSVQHLFAEGMIYAPDRAWADMVITQVAQFPKAKHDDLCLTGDTLILMADGTEKRIDQISVGDKVMTPNGGSGIVSASSMTGIKPIWELVHTHGILRGTENHPVMCNDVYKSLSSCSPGDMLETPYHKRAHTSWPFLKRKEFSRNRFFSTDINTTDIQIPQTHPTENIFPERGISFTGMFGNFITALFPRISTSIIRIGIASTMTFPILSAYQSENTKCSTWMKWWRGEGAKNNSSIYKRFEIKPRNGTEAQKVENGIVKMPLKALESLGPLNLSVKAITQGIVNGVGNILKQKALKKLCVQTHALAGNIGTSQVVAVHATNIMQPVYNLTVEGDHCYFANGILTHNCDTVSMSLRHMRDIGLIVRGPEWTAEIEQGMKQYTGSGSQPLYPA